METRGIDQMLSELRSVSQAAQGKAAPAADAPWLREPGAAPIASADTREWNGEFYASFGQDAPPLRHRR